MSWPHPVEATFETIRAEYETHDVQCTSNPTRAKLDAVIAERDALCLALQRIRDSALNDRTLSPHDRMFYATLASEALNHSKEVVTK